MTKEPAPVVPDSWEAEEYKPAWEKEQEQLAALAAEPKQPKEKKPKASEKPPEPKKEGAFFRYFFVLAAIC